MKPDNFHSPLVQAHIILDEKEDFVGEVGWPEGSSKVELL